MADDELLDAIASEYEYFLMQEGGRDRFHDFAEHLIRTLGERGWRIECDETEHVIEFRDDGWTIKHPLACRPNLFECRVNRLAGQQLVTLPDPDVLGRFECSVDGDRFLIGDRIEEATDA